MKIIVDVPKQDYIYITKKHCLPSCDERTLRNNYYEMIAKGVLLPKGYRRLGDLDELEQRISNFVEHDANITDEYTVTRQRFIVDGIKQTPTIIEADKEMEE